MIKKIFTLCFCLLSLSCFAATANAAIPIKSAAVGKAYSQCGADVSISDPQFCSQFPQKAACHCTEKGIDADTCNHPEVLYQALMDMFNNNLEAACNFQPDTDPQTCIESWNFYNNNCK